MIPRTASATRALLRLSFCHRACLRTALGGISGIPGSPNLTGGFRIHLIFRVPTPPDERFSRILAVPQKTIGVRPFPAYEAGTTDSADFPYIFIQHFRIIFARSNMLLTLHMKMQRMYGISHGNRIHCFSSSRCHDTHNSF